MMLGGSGASPQCRDCSNDDAEVSRGSPAMRRHGQREIILIGISQTPLSGR